MARALLLALSLSATLAFGQGPAAVKPPAALSDVMKAPRPQGGEYFGLYLLGKKVGFIFTDVSFADGKKDKVQVINEFVFKANVGNKVAERLHKEKRIYEAKPGGRLLSFVVTKGGDGGEEILEAIGTPTGLRITRKRPNFPNQIINLPAPKEVVEDADQARVALLRNSKVEGWVLDGMDLQTYRVASSLGPTQTRTINGVKETLRTVTTLSEKEKVPVEALITSDGTMVEINLGSNMRATKESEVVAKNLDQVEVFGLTRVVLPEPFPASAKTVPGRVTLEMAGLPDKFHADSNRQKFKKLPNGNVEVTLLAAFPSTASLKPRPLKDPTTGAPYLKTSILVESDAPDIQKLSKQIVGDEKDALKAAHKIVDWTYENLEKDYGASADRATDVLRQKKGDCTEHSLITVSLMRAAGIPARRIDGVLYMQQDDGVPAFYWHEWVEAYVGEWVQMDPTFGQKVADATHFAVGEEGNAEITPLIGQLKVLDVR